MHNVHDMWSSLGTEISWPSRTQQPRIQNHHISWRDRIRAFQHDLQKAEVRHGSPDPTKAVAWAVFQHHGHSHTPGSSLTVRRRRRPTRFKLEALMKHEVAHRSLAPEIDLGRCGDAGSILFDSFEIDDLLKTLDHAATAEIISDEAGEVVVDDLNKRGHHHGMWFKNLLHFLHLDGSLSLHWKLNHSELAPHCSMVHKGRNSDTHSKEGARLGHIDVAQFDAQFDRKEVHVSNDVHDPPGEEDAHHRHHLWKLLTQPFRAGRHKRHD